MTRNQAANVIEELRKGFRNFDQRLGTLEKRFSNLEKKQGGQPYRQGDMESDNPITNPDSPAARKTRDKTPPTLPTRKQIPSHSQGNQQCESSPEKERPGFFQSYIQPSASVFALVISILTLWNTVQTSKRSQRAYVTVTQLLGTSPVFSEFENKVITYVTKNSGLTPAMHYRIGRVDGVMEGGRCGSGHSHPGVYDTDDILGAGSEARSTFTITPLRHECMIDIDSGRTAFKISGILNYVDIFDQQHKTNFCWQYAAAPDRVFVPCKTGNDMD